MYKKVVTIVAIMMFGMVNLASAAVITFDNLETPGPGAGSIINYENQGFKIESELMFAYWCQDNNNGYNTSAALFITVSDFDATLSAIDGSLFTLNSIDLDTLYNNNGPSPVEFRAYDINDNLLATEGTTLTSNEWATLEFSSEFEDVAYVKWCQLDALHQFDNIVLNETGGPAPVPEPTTILLFGSGLIGIATIGRKKLFK